MGEVRIANQQHNGYLRELNLQSRPKWSHDGMHRVMPPSQTLRNLQGVAKAIGVTRVADTSAMDPLNIPVFSAIRPTDAEPGISVYNGKGLTKVQAKVGAIMEGVERYSAESWAGPTIRGTYHDLDRQGHPAFDPHWMHLQQRHAYRSDDVLEWGAGWDLMTSQPIWIPLNFLVFPYEGDSKTVWYRSTNGLASGNTREEAICHALAEVIERDAYTIAVVRTQLVPRLRAAQKQWVSNQSLAVDPTVDAEIFPNIALDTVSPRVMRLIEQMQQAGARVWLKNITSDIGIPTFIGSIFTAGANSTPLAAGGFGAHLNSEIAAIRALTEAVQGRNVQIQGAREDATKYARVIQPNHGTVLWCADTQETVSFSSIRSVTNADILDDIQDMIALLQQAGIQHAYIADLTDHALGIPVIRVIIPELESWFITDFNPDRAILGQRAQRFLP